MENKKKRKSNPRIRQWSVALPGCLLPEDARHDAAGGKNRLSHFTKVDSDREANDYKCYDFRPKWFRHTYDII